MPFDAKRFAFLMKRQAKTIYDNSKTEGINPKLKKLANLTFRVGEKDMPSVFIRGIDHAAASNHQALRYRAFHAQRLKELQEMKYLVQTGIPALGYDGFDIQIRVDAGENGPCLSVNVLESHLSDYAPHYTVSTKVLVTALQRLRKLPAPGDRMFRVEKSNIPANTAQDAYRIWAAFSTPHFFDPKANPKATRPVMYELLKTDALHAALIS